MRKVASVLSICIIAGLLIVYVPNIIAGAGKIGDTVNTMKTADLPFGKALYAAFLYGTFQLANVAVFVQHAKSFEEPQAKSAAPRSSPPSLAASQTSSSPSSAC